MRAGVLQIRAGEVLSDCAAEREQLLLYTEVGSSTRMDFAVSNYRLVAPGKCRGGLPSPEIAAAAGAACSEWEHWGDIQEKGLLQDDL